VGEKAMFVAILRLNVMSKEIGLIWQDQNVFQQGALSNWMRIGMMMVSQGESEGSPTNM
jgi:hypothetical protein